MKNVRRLSIVVLLIALAIMSFGSTGAQMEAPDVPVKLGVLSPITGPAASLGQEILNWQILAVEDFNERYGWEVEIVEGDTEIDPAVGVVAAEAVIADGDVYGATGPAGSQVVAATLDMFNEAGMAHISASATDPSLTADGGNGTFFRVVPSDDFQGPTIGSYLAENLGATALFIIDDQSTYSVGLSDIAGEVFEEAGGEIVGRESVTQDDIDFSALVTSIDSSGADAVFFPGQIASQGATLAQQLLEQGVDVILMGADGWQSQEDFIDAAAGATEGAYSTSFAPDVHELEAAADQVARYTEEYGDFTSFGPPAYAAATVVLEAMYRTYEADGELSREAVAAEVANTDMEDTILGIPISFADNGDLEGGSFFIFVVEDGAFVLQAE
jgi:branched-chain amino acid transport system substrate-binding protein